MWPLDTTKRQSKHNTYEAAITITVYCFLVNLILELADGQGHSSSLSFHFPHHANFDLDGFIFYLQKELWRTAIVATAEKKNGWSSASLIQFLILEEPDGKLGAEFELHDR